MALLAQLAHLQDSSVIVRVFKCAKVCHVALLEAGSNKSAVISQRRIQRMKGLAGNGKGKWHWAGFGRGDGEIYRRESIYVIYVALEKSSGFSKISLIRAPSASSAPWKRGARENPNDEVRMSNQ